MLPKSPAYIFTDHAVFEMKRRGLSEELVRRISLNPEQQLQVRPGRVVVQSRIETDGPSNIYLVRIFLDVDREPAEVVPVYRTSKFSKYWMNEQ